jgi:hypothetical protein
VNETLSERRDRGHSKLDLLNLLAAAFVAINTQHIMRVSAAADVG